MIREVTISGTDGKPHILRVEQTLDGQWMVNGETIAVDSRIVAKGSISLISGYSSYALRHDVQAVQSLVLVNGNRYEVEVRDPRSLRGRKNAADAGDGPRKINAPMPGKVVRILQPEGSQVEAAQGVIVIEAMKMQNELKSPKAGTVKKINYKEGDTVNAGDTLAIIE